MNNDQKNFDSHEENDEEYYENIHPEAFEEDIEFGDEVPDNFFDLLNNQKDLSIHYKQMVKIIARTNIIKTQNDNLKKHNLKINNIISDCEKLIGEENKENFKIEINAKKNLTKDELGKQSINFGIYGIPESILIYEDLVIIKKFVGPISEMDYKNIIDIVDIK